jgi:hypothetical protein
LKARSISRPWFRKAEAFDLHRPRGLGKSTKRQDAAAEDG